MNPTNKAEQIETICSAVLDKEKISPEHAEIIIKRSQVFVKIENKTIGQVTENNEKLSFQYTID